MGYRCSSKLSDERFKSTGIGEACFSHVHMLDNSILFHQPISASQGRRNTHTKKRLLIKKPSVEVL
jgi:hypothetical protein